MSDKDLIQEARTEFPAEPRQDAALPWRGVKITPNETARKYRSRRTEREGAYWRNHPSRTNSTIDQKAKGA